MKTVFSRGRRGLKRESVFGLCTAVIPLVGFLLFGFVPLIMAFSTMFVSMKGYQLDTMVWNNFANFKAVLTDPLFWKALRNSFLLLVGQFLSLLIALITSTLLAEKMRGHRFFTSLFFVPNICSGIAVTIIWMTMFNNDYGIINSILRMLFGPEAGIQWYNKPVPFFMMIFIILLWVSPGYGIVMYNAAFTGVPRSLYEAAMVDGANRWQRFRHVTLPGIAPTTFFLLMAGIINGLQQFDVPQLVSSALGNKWTGEAGPDNMGLTLMVYIYNKGIAFNNMPQAAVMSFFLFAIIVAVTAVNFKLAGRWNQND